MPVRTKELGRVAAIADNTVRTLYTCPAGRTAIVKDVAVWTSGSATIRVRVKRAGVSAIVWSGKDVNADQTANRATWIVLEPADELEVLRTTGSASYDCVVSGTELDGVAS